MTLKITNIRKKYIAPYADMIVCEEKECLLDTVSGFGQDPGGGGDNPEFAKGFGGIWDGGDYAGSDEVNNIFDNQP